MHVERGQGSKRVLTGSVKGTNWYESGTLDGISKPCGERCERALVTYSMIVTIVTKGALVT